MPIHIVAVGRMKAGPEQSLYDLYAKRITWPLKLVEVEEKRRSSAAELKKREGEKLLAALPKSAFVVALDENGKSYASEEFAKILSIWLQSSGDVVFLIGGADGHGKAVHDRADVVFSLGPATWPHMLVRSMLAEQIYRAQCILANHPYHRA